MEIHGVYFSKRKSWVQELCSNPLSHNGSYSRLNFVGVFFEDGVRLFKVILVDIATHFRIVSRDGGLRPRGEKQLFLDLVGGQGKETWRRLLPIRGRCGLREGRVCQSKVVEGPLKEDKVQHFLEPLFIRVFSSSHGEPKKNALKLAVETGTEVVCYIEGALYSWNTSLIWNKLS
jgi:hypothetical protein